MSGAYHDSEGWIVHDGERFGYCNSCGEEALEFDECCEDGEVVPYLEAGEL